MGSARLVLTSVGGVSGTGGTGEVSLNLWGHGVWGRSQWGAGVQGEWGHRGNGGVMQWGAGERGEWGLHLFNK